MVASNGSNGSAGHLYESEKIPSIVDNAAYAGAGSEYDLNDPHSGELLYKVSSVTKDTVQPAIESAATAFKSWKKTGPAERRAIFLRALALLEERKEEFIKISVHETTANIQWAQ